MRGKANLASRLQCVLLLFVVARTAAAGDIIYVDADAPGANNGSSWENAYVCLQNALADAAEKPVEIRVAQGIYKPDRQFETRRFPRMVSSGDRTATFQLINNMIIVGGYAGFGEPYPNERKVYFYETILSGDLNGNDGPNFTNNSENSYHVVKVGGGIDAEALLDGFTITAGNADGPESFGGGMYIDSGGPAVIDCTIIGNTAIDVGGGVYCHDSSRPYFIDSTITQNSARNHGGGVFCKSKSTPSIYDCTINGNSAEYGGGLYSDRGMVRVKNCTLSGNTARQDGGAIYSVRVTSQIESNIIMGNSAQRYGGGIFFDTSLRINNNLITDNSAQYGGGIYCLSTSYEMINNTIVGNLATGYGGGIYCDNSSPSVVNIILWNNSPDEIYLKESSITATYSNVQGGLPGVGNINADPLFVDADGADGVIGTEDDDLSLSPGSPCNNAGNSSEVPPWLVTDLDGNPRIMNDIVDMGAYEQTHTLTFYCVDAIHGDDNNDGLTHQAAFATIQKGIDIAADGDVVLVYPGLYLEEINFLGKALTVQGVAESPAGVPVLQNPGDFAVSFYSGEGPGSILKNIIIRDSFMGVFIVDSSPAISNLTIVNNKYGIEAYGGSEPDISNCILWNNTDGDLFGCQARYSLVQQESEPLEGLISYWKFDEDQGSIAYDSAGNNHGTIHGAQRTAGQVNGALSYDGEDDYVELPDNNPVWLPQFNFSFSAWVYFEREFISLISGGEVILDLNFGDSSNTANELGYNIHRSSDGGRLYFQMTTTTSSDEDLYSNESLAANRWYHIVAVREGGTQAIYVNGLLDASRTCSADPIVFVGGYDDDRINIGRFTTTIGHPRHHLKGKIDNVKIFDRALSAEEIQQLYQGIYGFANTPLFADPANNDYHLRSERGRYWPEHDIWVLDKVTSPCVDAGDPKAEVLNEPIPNGGRINIGAFGGTLEASLSPWQTLLPLPDQASIHSPFDGGYVDNMSVKLTWIPGDNADSHDVYFGTDHNAVSNATTESMGVYCGRQAAEMTTYDPGILELYKTYYWRIDEVIESDPENPSKGSVWSFTTIGFVILDDFEEYGAENKIWLSWHDGIGYGVPGDELYFPGNSTGAAVGDETSMDGSFMETVIVHTGRQSLPYFYDNNKQGYSNYSEATMTLDDPRDWTEQGIEALSLWFYGDPANSPELMYVAVANADGPTAVVYHDNTDAALIRTWTQWTIDLQEFADQGVNLADVNSIAIGIGDRNNPQPGGSGRMYFDDIRLCRR